MLHLLGRTLAMPTLVPGLVLAAACPFLAALARRQGRSPAAATALLLTAVSIGAVAFEVWVAVEGLVVLPPDTKVHPAARGLADSATAALLAGVATLAAALLTALVSRDLRRPALAAVPTAAALTWWSVALHARLLAFAWTPLDQKAAAWFGAEPRHLLLSLLVVVVGIAAAVGARSRVATVTALAPALVVVAWPGFLVGCLLAQG